MTLFPKESKLFKYFLASYSLVYQDCYIAHVQFNSFETQGESKSVKCTFVAVLFRGAGSDNQWKYPI